MMGSGAFLLIYAAVNAGHLKILAETGAKKSIIIISFVLCLIMFFILEIYTFQQSLLGVYAMFFLLFASFVIERVYRKLRALT